MPSTTSEPLIGKVITLSEDEVKYCEMVAKARTVANRSNDIPDKRIHPISDVLANDEGVYSEMAFCKLLNIYPRIFDLGPRSSSKNTDDGDAILPDGRIVDVKTTVREKGRLLVCHWKIKCSHVDVFALLTGKCPSYIFRGFITSEELFNEDRLRCMRVGAPMSYVAEQCELKELRDLDKGLVREHKRSVKELVNNIETDATDATAVTAVTDSFKKSKYSFF